MVGVTGADARLLLLLPPPPQPASAATMMAVNRGTAKRVGRWWVLVLAYMIRAPQGWKFRPPHWPDAPYQAQTVPAFFKTSRNPPEALRR
ncbi:Uncharacterised protein [Bordetella pertussis]|nr:Uncharacterised protein [Bordetella pertussis]